MTEEVKVVAGQIWKDWDSRNRDKEPGRRVQVETIEGDHAHVVNVDTGKRTQIKIANMRPTAKGWKFIAGPREDIVDEIEKVFSEPVSDRAHQRKIRKLTKRLEKMERIRNRMIRQGRHTAARKKDAQIAEAQKHLAALS